MSNIHPLALFRLTVLGPLISRDTLKHGELKRLLRELASKRYDMPYSKHCYLSEKTIEQWFYTWKRGGIDALAPKTRRDCGHSKLPMALQDALLEAKRENPKRSLDQLKALMEQSGLATRPGLSRSAIHRLLRRHQLSRPSGAASELVERRAYEARYAGDLWVGDVMHGVPGVQH